MSYLRVIEAVIISAFVYLYIKLYIYIYVCGLIDQVANVAESIEYTGKGVSHLSPRFPHGLLSLVPPRHLGAPAIPLPPASTRGEDKLVFCCVRKSMYFSVVTLH